MGSIGTDIRLNDGLTGVANSMYQSINHLVSGFERLNEASGMSFDNSAFIQAQQGFAQSIAMINQYEQELNRASQAQAAFQWNSISTPEIFNTTGIERAVQEMRALEQAAERVTASQSAITLRAAGMNILPSNAQSEIANVNNRIANIGNTMRILEREQRRFSRWNTSGINQYNNRVESLRSSMGQIERLQEDINRAVSANDVQRINSTYRQLVGIVDSVETNIRNNTSAQNEFNNAVTRGNKKANILGNSIKGYINEFMLFSAAKFGIKSTDEYINNDSRLGLITDNKQEKENLKDYIYKASMRSGGKYNDMTDTVSKLGLLAPDAFNDNKELVSFTELLNKSFRIGGASTQEQSAGMYQLTQAMASGRLQGDEFRSIIENAPMLANAIADYTGVGMEGLKKMSSEGKISADIIKNSLFSAAGDIESEFSQMPLTFGTIWNQIASTATVKFAGVMESINEKINSAGFQKFVDGIANSFDWIAERVTRVIDIVSEHSKGIGETFNNIASRAGTAIDIIIDGIEFLSDNWDILKPIIWGVVAAIAAYNVVSGVSAVVTGVIAVVTGLSAAATTLFTGAQWSLNGAMYACPLAWIIMLIIALIAVFYAAVAAVNHFAGTSISATGLIIGYFAAMSAFIGNLFFELLILVLGLIESLVNGFVAFVNFLGNCFNSPVESIIRLFGDMGDNVLGIIEKIAQAIDTLIGTNFQSMVAGFRKFAKDAVYYTADRFSSNDEEYKKVMEEFDANGLLEELGIPLTGIDPRDAFNWGNGLGKKLGGIGNGLIDALKGLVNIDDFIFPKPPSVPDTPPFDNSDDIGSVGNVGSVDKINTPVDIESEDLKFMKEMAEQESINKYMTTILSPEFKVTFGDVKETADVNKLADKIKEIMESDILAGVEGLHV